MKNDAWQHARSILAIRLDNLGDVLLTTPAFRAIRESLPESRITLLAGRAGAQIAELDPDIDDVMVYEAPWMDVQRYRPPGPAAEMEMVARIAERKFDAAVIFTSYHQSPLPAAYLCYLAGIPLRLAASIDFPGSLLTTRHKHPEQLVHEVRRGLDLVGAVGFAVSDDRIVLELSAGDRPAARDLLLARGVGGAVVAVHPGCSCQARTYPWQLYARAADLLVEELGCSIVLTGSPEETAVVEQIAGAMRNPVESLAGETSLRELAAVLAEADVVVTGNTGPMHVAAAVQTPVVALFALTNPPQQWGPWRVRHRMLYEVVPCAICYSFVCPVDHACLAGVSPQQVLAAVSQLLFETGERVDAPAAEVWRSR